MSGFDTTSARRAPAQPFRPPGPSVARRDIVLRQPVSGKGALVTSGPEPRALVFDSGGEEKLALLLLTHRDVTCVEEQYGPIKFDGSDGRAREHWFDFRVTLRGGVSRYALAYKPAVIAERRGFLEELKLIASQMSPNVAQAIVPVSERKIPRHLVHNARLIHAVRQDRPSAIDGEVAAIAGSLNGTCTIGEIVRASGHGCLAFRALVRLVDDGTLVIPRGSRLDYDTVVGLAADDWASAGGCR